MDITNLRIERFRSIKELDIALSPTTVFIGPNNSGKTAILDALRIALTRRWGQRGTGFTEYDVHLAGEMDDPRTSPGVVIELEAAERTPGEWSEELQQDLHDTIQLDPTSGTGSISLRVSCAWSAPDRCFEPSWAFLNAARQPLVGGGARRTNLERFWKYVPVFYLGAMRDADDEFSSRSQFWGRLLKAMVIPPDVEARVQETLAGLNDDLLQADPRLKAIADSVSRATDVAAKDRAGGANLRMIPSDAWDLLSKAEIIIRNDADSPWLPLLRQGQGLQSLSVIFLFNAFVEHMLAELYAPGSTPILEIEEPETHLHPQAARVLWQHVNALPGQKIVATHSPYFVQHVPFRDLRLVRLTDNGTEVNWLPASFSAPVPCVPSLDPVLAKSRELLSYRRPDQTITVNGVLTEDLYRDLLTVYADHPEKEVIVAALRKLRDKSRRFVPDSELRALETYARRIRGEIFFADRWLIVEGQAEFLLLHAIARAMGYDLDEHGVAVIDAVNNGNPEAFAALAWALGIPWLAVFDGDSAGLKYCETIAARDYGTGEMSRRCTTLPGGNLEQQLMADGLEGELRSTLLNLGMADAMTLDRPTLEKRLDKNKTKYAAELAKRILDVPAMWERMPEAFRLAILSLRGLR